MRTILTNTAVKKTELTHTVNANVPQRICKSERFIYSRYHRTWRSWYDADMRTVQQSL